MLVINGRFLGLDALLWRGTWFFVGVVASFAFGVVTAPVRKSAQQAVTTLSIAEPDVIGCGVKEVDGGSVPKGPISFILAPGPFEHWRVMLTWVNDDGHVGVPAEYTVVKADGRIVESDDGVINLVAPDVARFNLDPATLRSKMRRLEVAVTVYRAESLEEDSVYDSGPAVIETFAITRR